ncbi:hypothetical protein [Haloglycomyces albus]|uniref:hypothetical protein n=1 Tax=Haloglycomyces albus TaxID=526067 RepID=UPI00046D524C|nr:hypothetical protein [Haloglycomyces albus]
MDRRRDKKTANPKDEAKPFLEPNTSIDDPPRDWRKVGAMAGAWIVALGMGAWLGPAVAQGGADGEDEVALKDQAPASEKVAADRYLQHGSKGNEEYVAICDGADPEVGIATLKSLRDDFESDTGKAGQVDIRPVDSYEENGLYTVVRDLFFQNDSRQHYRLQVSVLKQGNGFCVSNAVFVDDGGTESESEGGSVTPEQLAIEFVNQIRKHNDPIAAREMQCVESSGDDPQKVVEAIQEITSSGYDSGRTGSNGSAELEEDVVSVPLKITFQNDNGADSLQVNLTVDVNVTGDSCVSNFTTGDELEPWMPTSSEDDD